MKAILVIDLPKNCAECKLMFLQGIGEGICNAVDWEERPSWCPLRPIIDDIPEDESAVYVRGFLDGVLNIVDDDEEGETE